MCYLGSGDGLPKFQNCVDTLPRFLRGGSLPNYLLRLKVSGIALISNNYNFLMVESFEIDEKLADHDYPVTALDFEIKNKGDILR